ncbi:MAG: hypothetical protein R2845_17110 [Thermomicrobiales bacterium]
MADSAAHKNRKTPPSGHPVARRLALLDGAVSGQVPHRQREVVREGRRKLPLGQVHPPAQGGPPVFPWSSTWRKLRSRCSPRLRSSALPLLLLTARLALERTCFTIPSSLVLAPLRLRADRADDHPHPLALQAADLLHAEVAFVGRQAGEDLLTAGYADPREHLAGGQHPPGQILRVALVAETHLGGHDGSRIEIGDMLRQVMSQARAWSCRPWHRIMPG